MFKTTREQPDESVTIDGVCEELVIHGSPQKVIDELLAFHDKVGDFGTLLYAGKDWGDRKLARRSMVLMAEEVMPRSTPRSAALPSARRRADNVRFSQRANRKSSATS